MTSKPWWRSKTMWVNLIVFEIGAIGLVLDMGQALALPPRWEVWLVLAAAVLNLALRTITRQPVRRGR